MKEKTRGQIDPPSPLQKKLPLKSPSLLGLREFYFFKLGSSHHHGIDFEEKETEKAEKAIERMSRKKAVRFFLFCTLEPNFWLKKC